MTHCVVYVTTTKNVIILDEKKLLKCFTELNK